MRTYKTLTFRPAINQDRFPAFFCCADGWGLFHKASESYKIETFYGDLSGYKVIGE